MPAIDWSKSALNTITSSGDVPSKMITDEIYPRNRRLIDTVSIPTGQANSEGWLHLTEDDKMPTSLYATAQIYYTINMES